MEIVLAGATGFLGSFIVKKLLAQGHNLVLLSRKPPPESTLKNKKIKFQYWDGLFSPSWAGALKECNGVINLSGEGIAEKRWTRNRKKTLFFSRIGTTAALVKAVSKMESKPDFFINGSAIGYYGNVEFGEVTEKSSKGDGFLADLCQKWEEEAKPVADLGVRLVQIRTGMVLGKGGGILNKIIPPFKFFVGGHLGSGNQWFSWIHTKDFTNAVLFVMENPKIAGAVNFTSPEPVPMREFCKTLGKTMKRPSWAHLPPFFLKMVLGELSESIISGQKVVPEKLKLMGFKFVFPQLKDALEEIHLS